MQTRLWGIILVLNAHVADGHQRRGTGTSAILSTHRQLPFGLCGGRALGSRSHYAARGTPRMRNGPARDRSEPMAMATCVCIGSTTTRQCAIKPDITPHRNAPLSIYERCYPHILMISISV